MTENNLRASTPWHLWMVGLLLLLWQGMASFDYFATVTRFEPYLSKFPDAALEYYFNAPAWMWAAWGVAAFGGLFGAILLLLRNKLAVVVTAAAIASSMITVVYTHRNPPPGTGGGEFLFMMIVVFAALLVLAYMYWLKRRGVLR